MDEMFKIIANVGFPIAVAAWLLVRVEQLMEKLTNAIIELREAIIMQHNPGSVGCQVAGT